MRPALRPRGQSPHDVVDWRDRDSVGGGGPIRHNNPWHWKNEEKPHLPRRSPRRVVSHEDLSSALPALRTPSSKSTGVKRFNGHSRTFSEWDGLRKDSELWIQDGDCLVHLYGKGKSRRGPAFKVRADLIRASQCGRLLSDSFHARTPSTTSSIISSRFDTGSIKSDSGYSSMSSADGMLDIFIPAIDDSTRHDAFACHLATRNLFAWMLDKPVVGSSLGSAMIELLDRMLLVRPATSDNVQDCLEYAERQGYLDFAHSPDYALSMLRFAEHFHIWELWRDAFAHCVGMNDSLSMSAEFEPISRVTKALITRSSLEMDLHLGRVTRALGNFLEDELSPSHLGLAAAERGHMDRFRSFVHSFYVAKYGYWPPPPGLNFEKELLRSLCDEFLDLYDYLADEHTSDAIDGQSGPATGGLCVRQNVMSFNERHNYEPLPHPLPLLPRYDESSFRPQSSRGWRSFSKSSRAVPDSMLGARAALLTASNNVGPEIEESPIVQAYISFEHQSLLRQEDRLSMTDARKVRWIFIYCTLQMLVSVTKAPDGIRDPVTPSYHMCCLVPENSPWQGERNNVLSVHPALRTFEPSETSSDCGTPLAEDFGESARSTSPAMSIHPDCEDDGNYFSAASRNNSTVSFGPTPLRVRSSSLSRSGSIISLPRRFSRRASTRGSVSLSTSNVNDLFNHPGLDTSQLASTDEEEGISPSVPDFGVSEEHEADADDATPPANALRTPTLDSVRLSDSPLSSSSATLDDAAMSPSIPRSPSPLDLQTSNLSEALRLRSQSLMSAFSATTISSEDNTSDTLEDEEEMSSDDQSTVSTGSSDRSSVSRESSSPTTPVSVYRWSLSPRASSALKGGESKGQQSEKRMGFVHFEDCDEVEDKEIVGGAFEDGSVEGMLPKPLEIGDD